MTNKLEKSLLLSDSLDVDQAFRDFCNAIKKAAKNSIPSSHQNDHILRWNTKYEGLFQTFPQSSEMSDFSRAATELLNWLDKKWKNQ